MRSTVNRWLLSGRAKLAWFLVSIAPFFWMLWGAANDQLGANPAEALVRATGDWTLRALCVVLAVTPIRVLGGMSALARMRRMAGLFVYFYATLHLLCYSWFDREFDLAGIANDVAKRSFILVGFLAFVLLTPLALTSFNRAIRTLGATRWQMLHRLVYAIAGLSVLHFFWMRAGKNDFAEVAVYAAVLGSLPGWRVAQQLRRT